jgi:hypothetical protein
MKHAARRLRSWLIFDVRRNERVYLAACGEGGYMIISVHSVTCGVRALLLHSREGISPRLGGLRELFGGCISRVLRVLFATGMWRLRASSMWRIRASLPRSLRRSAVTGRANRGYSRISVGRAVWPNKAPEPTPTAVTPRAMEAKFEMKGWICNRDEARGAPAAGVAHL